MNRLRTCSLFAVILLSLNGGLRAANSQSALTGDDYSTRIQPIFTNRCIACHSCYNAPCQLNLQSYSGLARGATKLNVYDRSRLESIAPSRPDIDGHSVSDWRARGFFEVVGKTTPARSALAGVDHIIHGGDIGNPDIINALQRIAPVTAIKGNVDTDDWAGEYADTEFVRLAGRSFYVLHDLNALQVDPIAQGFDVVISGHSHVPKIETIDSVLYLNPGSAGRRRFKLPITLATLDITLGGIRPVIHDLEPK